MAFGAKFEGRHRACLLDNVSLFEHKSVIKLTMAVFFNCSFARAAVKSYTSDLAVRNQPLTHDGRKKRLERFREQFSFTDAEVTANPQLSSFSAATHCSDRFDQHCTVHGFLASTTAGGQGATVQRGNYAHSGSNNSSQLYGIIYHDCSSCRTTFMIVIRALNNFRGCTAPFR